MRWGRFFGLWLPLSVIWVVASGYLQELRTFQFWRAPILQFESPSGQKFSIDTSKNQNEITAELNAALGRSRQGDRVAPGGRSGLGLAQQLRQLGDVDGDPPRLVAEQAGTALRQRSCYDARAWPVFIRLIGCVPEITSPGRSWQPGLFTTELISTVA
jgi:hypothetical protein